MPPGSTSDEPVIVDQDEAQARAQLVLTLRGRGVGDRAVLSAIERVPRRLFLSAIHHGLAYEDSALPIECGQTVLSPSFVARVVQYLEVQKSHRVLEIGTGSGYQAAVLGHLGGEVHSIDRYRTLAELAGQRIAALKLPNVKIHHGDGLAGMGKRGPFDRIVLTGAVIEVPEVVMSLLSEDGLLIAPQGEPCSVQSLVRIRRTAGAYSRETLANGLRLTALVPGQAEFL